jgi:hypothetical protein
MSDRGGGGYVCGGEVKLGDELRADATSAEIIDEGCFEI